MDDFVEFRSSGAYLIDKSSFLYDLGFSMGTSYLFTRPRRFGKSLFLSMAAYFLSTKEDPGLFRRLDIEDYTKESAEIEGKRNSLSACFGKRRIDEAEQTIDAFLAKSVGIHDYARRSKDAEAFYHGLLLGQLFGSKGKRGDIYSNKESGEGFLDLAYQSGDGSDFIIAVKCSKTEEEFLSFDQSKFIQIEAKRYNEFFYRGEPSMRSASFSIKNAAAHSC